MRRSILAAWAVIAAGCVSRAPAIPSPTGREPVGAAWPATVVAAHRELSEGRHSNADRLLREFAAAYPRTAEASESFYWRAIVALDPTNDGASPRDAAELLDGYLASRLPLTHRAEATVLRALAVSLAAPARGSGTPGGAVGESRDAEMQRLKQELESTKAELERIRKRLAPPPPPPPPTGTPPPPLL